MVAGREELRTDATQSVEKLKKDIKSAGSAFSSDLSALQAKVSADGETLKANVKRWKKDLDAKRAENWADELEWEASMAIDYAISSVEQAKLAAIDAVIVRQEAIDARPGKPHDVARPAFFLCGGATGGAPAVGQTILLEAHCLMRLAFADREAQMS